MRPLINALSAITGHSTSAINEHISTNMLYPVWASNLNDFPYRSSCVREGYLSRAKEDIF